MAFRVVGAVGIKVRPDTTKFDDELKNDLRRKGNVRVEVPVSPDSSNFREDLKRDVAAAAAGVEARIGLKANGEQLASEATREARRAEKLIRDMEVGVKVNPDRLVRDAQRSIQNVVNEVNKHGAAVRLIAKIEADRFKRELHHLIAENDDAEIALDAILQRESTVRAQLAILTRNRYLDLFVRVNKASVATAMSTLMALSGINLLQRAQRMVVNLLTNIDSIALSFAKTTSIVATAAAGIMTSVAGVSGLLGGIGQLGGFALGLPAMAGSIAAFVTVIVGAFKNFNTAMGGDTNALAKLPIQAQNAVLALQGVWTSMQAPIQEAYWSKMGGTLENLVQYVIPQMRTGLTKVSAEAGKMSSQFIGAFIDSGGRGVFATMFDDMATGMASATRGARPFMSAIITLGEAGSSTLPRVGEWLADIAMQFDSWVRRSQEAGKIDEWFDNAAKAAGNLGQIFVQTSRIFTGLTDAIESGGGGNLVTFEDRLRKISQVVNGAAFQGGMANLFNGAFRAIDGLKGGLGDLGYALLNISPLLGDIMALSGSTIGSILSGISSGIQRSDFLDGFRSMFESIAEGVDGFLLYAPDIFDGIGALAGSLGIIFQEALPAIGAVIGQVATVFREDLKPIIDQLSPTLIDFASTGAGVFISALGLVLDVLQPLVAVFDALPEGIQTTLLWMAVLARFSRSSLAGALSASTFAPAITGLRNLASSYRDAAGAASTYAMTSRQNPNLITPIVPLGAGTTVRDSASTGTAAGAAFGASWGSAARAATSAVAGAAGTAAGLALGAAATASAGAGGTAAGAALGRGLTAGSTGSAMVAGGLAAQAFIRGFLGPLAAGYAAAAASSSASMGALTAAAAGQGAAAGRAYGMAYATATRLDMMAALPVGSTVVNAAASSGAVAGGAFGRGFGDTARAGLARVTSAVGTLGSAIGRGFMAIGGPWLVGIAAVLSALSSAQERTEALKSSAEEAARAYREIGEAVAASGLERFGAVEVDTAVLDYFDSLANTQGFQANWAGFYGDSKSLESVLNGAGFSRDDVVAFATGRGGEAAAAFLQSYGDQLEANSGNWLSRMGEDISFWNSDDVFSTNQVAAAEVRQLLALYGEARQEEWRFLQTAEGREKHVAGVLEDINAGYGKTTLNNIKGISAALRETERSSDTFSLGTELAKDMEFLSDKTRIFGAAFATALGGETTDYAKNVGLVQKALKGYNETTGMVEKSAFGMNYQISEASAIFNTLSQAGVPIGRIKSALTEFGYSTEDIQEAINLRFGPAMDRFGQAVTVGGEKVGRFSPMSNGLLEFSNALSAVAGIDAKDIYNSLSLGGIDPTSLATGLAGYGYSVQEIIGALEGMDYSGDAAALAIVAVRDAAKQMNGVVPQNFRNYALAMDEIAKSADDAATKADKLWAALQLLKGNPLESWEIQANAFQAIDDAALAVENLKKELASEQGIKLFDDEGKELTGTALETALAGVKIQAGEVAGEFDAASKVARELDDQFINLSRTGLAGAQDAFDKAIKSGAGLPAAFKAAQDAISPTQTAIEDLIGQLGLTDTEAAKVRDTFNLMPKEWMFQVIANAGGVEGELAKVWQQLNSLGAGQTIDIEVSKEAADQLDDLGFKVLHFPDGTAKVTIDGDDQAAKDKLAALTLLGQDYTVWANVDAETKDAIAKMLGLETFPVFPIVPVDASMDRANETLRQWTSGAPTSWSPYVNVGADPNRANAIMNQWTANAPTSWSPYVNVGASTNPATSIVNQWSAGVPSSYSPYVNVGANTNPAANETWRWVQNANGAWVYANVDAKTGAAQAAINRLNGQSITITIGAQLTGAANQYRNFFGLAKGGIFNGAGVKTFADGGLFGANVSRFAGGSEKHVAQIAKGAWPVRIWAEPETGGEAYIPLADAKRERSLAILAEVANRFGYSLSKLNGNMRSFANGGLHQVSGSASGGAAPVIQVTAINPVAEPTSKTVAKAGDIAAQLGGF